MHLTACYSWVRNSEPSDSVWYRSWASRSSARSVDALNPASAPHYAPFRPDTPALRQMRMASQRGARVVLIVGDEEVRQGTVVVRDMTAGSQTSVAVRAANWATILPPILQARQSPPRAPVA